MIRSLAETPVSAASAMLTAGAVLSSVKLSVAVPVLPARSVWLAVRRGRRPPTRRGEAPGPVASAVAVPSVVPPSLMVTRVLACPAPLTRRVRGNPVARRGAGI